MSKKQSLLLFIRIATDLSMVSIAWVSAYLLRFYTFFPTGKGIPSFELYAKLLPFICVIWLAVLSAAGFYRRTGQHRSAFIEGLDILQTCSFAALGFISFSYFYEEYRYSRGVLIIFFFLHLFLIITGRSVIRKLLRWYRRHAPPRHVLIAAYHDSLSTAYDLLAEAYAGPQKVVGALRVGGDQEIWQAVCERLKLPMLEKPEDMGAYLRKENIQSVVLAIPQQDEGFLESNLAIISDQVSDIRIVPDLRRYKKLASGIEVVKGLPVINLHDSPLDGMGSVLKRAMDVLGAAFGLIILSPLFLVLSALVKLSSPGPVFYKQKRVGLDGNTFMMLKFRSMPVDAESQTGAVWAKKEDNRATLIGSILRKSSLDELPQLFNILVGDMSLVGPRPERPVFVDEFRQNIPGYMLRHKVKAGLTGWAQINGWRGNTSLEKRIECDLYYIQNWSLWLDIRILFVTLYRGFFSKNAY